MQTAKQSAFRTTAYKSISMMKRNVNIVLLLLLAPALAGAQEIVPLYSGAIPNAKNTGFAENTALPANGVYNRVATPTLEVYLAAKERSTGAGVIICPGGGYSVIVYQGEGIGTAKQLSAAGLTAFVLKYRLPNDSTMNNKAIGPVQDAQQAIKLVRENAARWGLDKAKIGIMGFSAGGHLAATAATHFDEAYIENKNNTSLRPDFQVLVYPVISMGDSLTHRDSRRKLLGTQPARQNIVLFSNERQATSDSPPAYLTHTADDKVVDVDNSVVYFERLRKQGVPVEMHIYPKGDHGFIFQNKEWIQPLLSWLKANGWVRN